MYDNCIGEIVMCGIEFDCYAQLISQSLRELTEQNSIWIKKSWIIN